jgi:cardiolipin synthase A/B
MNTILRFIEKGAISLEVIGAIAFILVIIIILLWIDYKWGQARNRQKTKKIIFPRRRSDITVFGSGPELFQDFFTEIEQAKKHIHILFYIIKNDSFSQQFLHLLEQKANNGIKVRLLVDRIGAYKLSKQAITSLKQSGVHFSYSFTPRFPFLFYHLQKRNHRKVTIIDGKIGYLGGFNIGKEYINEDPKLSPWRDYHLKITGEGVQDLQTSFLTDWLNATEENLLKDTQYFPPLSPGTQEHQVFTVDGEGLEQTFAQLIENAKKHIIIGTPYFIPSRTLLTQLTDAIGRGVKVTIIVPKTSDHILVKEASYRSFRTLLQKGATILQFHKGFYHSKITQIDDKTVDIGTANFDKRSLFLNSEINCLMYDALSIEQAKKCLSHDMANSLPIQEKALTNPNLFQKTKETAAYLMSPFL